ncbi:MAG: Spy/CpxP family protein refolding chaperone [Flavobacteriaceae bacterium]|jgi:Spy/CpxP family protein refolding chaperone|nr:Spy/CpxP family protein refolding chaperone [Flavobacteriaceae bacterium]
MKRLVLLGLILASTTAFSQVGDRPQPTKEEMEKKKQEFKDKMAKDLNLTPEQVQKINAIDQKYKSQEETLKTQSKSLKKQHETLMDSKKSEIDKVLTDEQKQKLKDMKQKFHDKKDGAHRPQKPAPNDTK